MSRKAVLAVALSVGGAVLLGIAALLTWLLWPGAVDRAMRLAPPGAELIVHIEVQPLLDEMFASLRKNKEKLGLPANVNIDEIEKLYRRVDSFDVFFLDEKVEPPLVAVVRTDLTPKELQDAMQAFGQKVVPLKDIGNGRYDDPAGKGLRIIFGGEAKDVPKGRIVFGPAKLLTDDYVAGLGKGRTDRLRKLLADVDTSAPVWVAGSLAFTGDRESPERLVGWVDPRGKARGEVRMTFRNERAAKDIAENMLSGKGSGGGIGELLGSLLEIKQDGDSVTMKVKPVEDFTGRLFEAVAEARRAAQRAMSMANLHALGTCLMVYSHDNAGRFPDSLDGINEDYGLSPRMLVAPASGHEPPKFVDGKIVGDVDYVYLGAGLGLDHMDLSSLILAHEKPEINNNEGTNVLYGDGHVECVAMDKFRADLERTMEVVNRLRPQTPPAPR